MHVSRPCTQIWKSRNICTRNQTYDHTQPPPIRAVPTALRSWAPPIGAESASTGMLTICPQHIATLPDNGSPNHCLDADSAPHHPARNACCLMAPPALVLSAQTRHTSRVSDSCFVRLLRTQSLHVHKPYPLSQSTEFLHGYN